MTKIVRGFAKPAVPVYPTLASLAAGTVFAFINHKGSGDGAGELYMKAVPSSRITALKPEGFDLAVRIRGCIVRLREADEAVAPIGAGETVTLSAD